MIIKILTRLIYDYHKNLQKLNKIDYDIGKSTDLGETIELIQKQSFILGKNDVILQIISGNYGEYDIKDNKWRENVYNRLIDNIQEIIDNEEDFRDISINELKSRSLD